MLMDHEQYRGINEDRSLKQLCGYPLCSNPLSKQVRDLGVMDGDEAQHCSLDAKESVLHRRESEQSD